MDATALSYARYREHRPTRPQWGPIRPPEVPPPSKTRPGRRSTQQVLAAEARQYIRANYTDGERCGTARIAEALGVTASHLCHVYRAVFGVTLGADVRRLRIDLARGLLADLDRPIKEIAGEVGYVRSTYRAFFNAFRAETGLSPSAYRRRHRVQAARQALTAAEPIRPVIRVLDHRSAA